MQDESQWPAVSEGSIIDDEGQRARMWTDESNSVTMTGKHFNTFSGKNGSQLNAYFSLALSMCPSQTDA